MPTLPQTAPASASDEAESRFHSHIEKTLADVITEEKHDEPVRLKRARVVQPAGCSKAIRKAAFAPRRIYA